MTSCAPYQYARNFCVSIATNRMTTVNRRYIEKEIRKSYGGQSMKTNRVVNGWKIVRSFRSTKSLKRVL